MSNETASQRLDRLFKENGLIQEDWFVHSQYRIIRRTGIEKIQYQNNIRVAYEAVLMSTQLCVVKATAIKTIVNQDTGEEIKLEIQTFGSAGLNGDGTVVPRNKESQYLYLPEMAEKRALSRCVLKCMGLYELGVFGEDESDEWGKREPAPPRKSKQELAQAANANVQAQPEPTDPEAAATANQQAEYLKLIGHKVITEQERNAGVEKMKGWKSGQIRDRIVKLKIIIEERLENQKRLNG